MREKSCCLVNTSQSPPQRCRISICFFWINFSFCVFRFLFHACRLPGRTRDEWCSEVPWLSPTSHVIHSATTHSHAVFLMNCFCFHNFAPFLPLRDQLRMKKKSGSSRTPTHSWFAIRIMANGARAGLPSPYYWNLSWWDPQIPDSTSSCTYTSYSV